MFSVCCVVTRSYVFLFYFSFLSFHFIKKRIPVWAESCLCVSVAAVDLRRAVTGERRPSVQVLGV